MVEFKSYEEVKDDFYLISEYAREAYDATVGFMSEDDYLRFKNRLRHLLELVEKEGE